MPLKQFAEIRKVDEESRMVWGYASTEAIDSQGETVTKEAMRGAWDDYMKFANVREMHQPSAVGIVKEFDFDETGVMIGAYVVDDSAWEKVKAGVYKGFSIGGKKLADGYDAVTKTISKLRLSEISLVDRPANPEALISVWKGEDLDPEAPEAPNGDGIKLEDVKEFLKSEEGAELLKGILAAQLAAQAAPDNTNSTEELNKAQEIVQDEKKVSELRKAFRLLKGSPEEVRKGLYEVGELAQLLQWLACLQSYAQYEAEYEGDNSPVPAQLMAAVKQLGDALVAMAQEEVAELLPEAEGAEGVVMLFDKVQVQGDTSLVKLSDALDAMDTLKAGARNSGKDAERIQKAHDLMAELGAACAKEEATTNKGEHEVELAKALGVADGLKEELSTLQKSFGELSTSHEELRKQFDALPAPQRGALRVIEKGDEMASEVKADVDPILKADGTVDEVATSIKQIYAGGGRSVF